MYYLNKAMISLCTIMVFMGCSSKDMKQFGGNMMTTGGGSPIGALVGVGLGGAIYGMGTLAENQEEEKVLAQRQSASQDTKDDDNSTFVYMSNLIESKNVNTENTPELSSSEIEKNTSK